MTHLVSIIMPSYNAARFIGAAIESVQAQSYTTWELLITDDCSTDNSVSVIESYAQYDPRIRLFALKSNIGAAQARNHALANAKGDIIAFLDSDDMWASRKLEQQLAFMLANNYAFTITNYRVIAEDGTLTAKEIQAPKQLSYRSYLHNTIIGCLTVMINKNQTGDFRMPNIKSSHDMALWLLIMRRGFKVYGLQESLASYRLVSNSNTAKKWKAAQDVWRVYRQYEKLNILYAAFNFCGYAINAILKRL